MRLYHYVHCPFCLRVRMSLGKLNIAYESVVVAYDDEATPIRLSGQKMLPIFEFSSTKIMNESLDIISDLDQNKILNLNHYQIHKNEIDRLLNQIGSNVHSLCMPYWIWTPEFNEASRQYFRSKKEMKRGPFKKLVQDKDHFIKNLDSLLTLLEEKLTPFYQSPSLTIVDIMIASHLWGLYIFPEFQFTPKMHQYLQSIKSECHFEYHQDFWK
jgi:glutaredoxin 2